jgi:hypothetical protein
MFVSEAKALHLVRKVQNSLTLDLHNNSASFHNSNFIPRFFSELLLFENIIEFVDSFGLMEQQLVGF